MCGIAGYVGALSAAPLVFHTLGQLEYRGYDSAGIAVRTPEGRIEIERTVQGVTALASLLVRPDLETAGAGIGHTRWATHGAVTEANAHPLQDCTGRLAVAHNGVIANADTLRHELTAAGHEFAGEVDSEVICHLLEEAMSGGATLPEALETVTPRLLGSWAIVALDGESGHVAATVHRSPLVIAEGRAGTLIASDVNAIADSVDAYQVLADGDVVDIGPAGVTWSRPRSAPGESPLFAVRWRPAVRAEGDHPDHMGNEIDEQPETAARIVQAHASGIADGSVWRSTGLPPLDRIERVVVLGCGTSLHAGRIIGSVFARLGGLPVTSVVASEAAAHVMEPATLVIAISQSGETADILAALDHLPRGERVLLAVTNNPTSSLARIADAVIDCLAGPEIGVAATKTFVAQVLTGVGLAVSGLAAAGRLDAPALSATIARFTRTPEHLSAALAAWAPVIPALTDEFADAPGFLLLGRGSGVVYAAEGALKLKELTYRWTEHQPAGELKHGPLALVSRGTPVFVLDSDDPRLDVSIAEVAARGGRIVRVGRTPDARSVGIPRGDSPAWGDLEAVVPLQLFARSLALRLGYDVDRPRNLAKSVTVE